MATLFMTYEVEDFDRWRRAFDDRESMRTEHGVRSHRLFQDPDNDRRITVVLEVDGASRAEALLDSEEWQRLHEEAGVKDAAAGWVAEAFEDVTYPRPVREEAFLEQGEVIL